MMTRNTIVYISCFPHTQFVVLLMYNRLVSQTRLMKKNVLSTCFFPRGRQSEIDPTLILILIHEINHLVRNASFWLWPWISRLRKF